MAPGSLDKRVERHREHFEILRSEPAYLFGDQPCLGLIDTPREASPDGKCAVRQPGFPALMLRKVNVSRPVKGDLVTRPATHVPFMPPGQRLLDIETLLIGVQFSLLTGGPPGVMHQQLFLLESARNQLVGMIETSSRVRIGNRDKSSRFLNDSGVKPCSSNFRRRTCRYRRHVARALTDAEAGSRTVAGGSRTGSRDRISSVEAPTPDGSASASAAAPCDEGCSNTDSCRLLFPRMGSGEAIKQPRQFLGQMHRSISLTYLNCRL